MNIHQDTSTERARFEAWARPGGYNLRRNEVLGHYSNIDTLRAWEGWQAALASRDEVAQQPQGQTPDHSKLLKMIAHRARCFPSYPMGYHLPEVFAAVGEAPPEHTVPVPQGQAVSDEQLREIDDAHDWQTTNGRMAAYRAILALRDKPEQRVPLSDDFATIAGLESAVGHLSTLVDEQRALLVESEDVFGRDGHGGRYEDGECNLIDRIRAHLEMTAPPPNGTTAKEQGK